MVETRREVRQVGGLPRTDGTLEQPESVGVQRTQQRADRGPQRPAVVEPRALDQPGQVWVRGQVIEQAVDVPFDVRGIEPAAGALFHERDDGRHPARERRFVERALVGEVVVEARLVAQARLGGDLARRDAGEAALREAALGRVEDRVARRRRFRSWDRRRAHTPAGGLSEQTFVCQRGNHQRASWISTAANGSGRPTSFAACDETTVQRSASRRSTSSVRARGSTSQTHDTPSCA